MAQSISIECACGSVKWGINSRNWGRLIKCYCADCQSHVRHLRRAEDYLGENGTEIFQTTPDNVHFTKGREHLAVLRLSPNGILRWYTQCCCTPVANTLATAALPFCGLPLQNGAEAFGPIRAHANTARAAPPRNQSGVFGAIATLVGRAAWARLTGKPRHAPFFESNGRPIAEPMVLTLDERNKARETN